MNLYVISIKLYFLINLQLTVSIFRKTKIKKRSHLFLPSVIQFEVKGNSLGWIPIEIDDSKSNINNYFKLYSDYCKSKEERMRRHLNEDANFISGALSCSHNNATIEPDTIYDGEDEYENEENTSSLEKTTEKNRQIIETTTTKYEKETSISSLASSNVSSDSYFNASTSKMQQTTTVLRTTSTMPTKGYAPDECKSTTAVKTTACNIKTTNGCFETTKQNKCTNTNTLPQIITPPCPLPPVDLDFLDCSTTEKNRKAEELTNNSNDYTTVTSFEVSQTKKPSTFKPTTEPNNKNDEETESNESGGSSIAPLLQTTNKLSKLQILFPPLRYLHQKTSTSTEHSKTTTKHPKTTTLKKHGKTGTTKISKHTTSTEIQEITTTQPITTTKESTTIKKLRAIKKLKNVSSKLEKKHKIFFKEKSSDHLSPTLANNEQSFHFDDNVENEFESNFQNENQLNNKNIIGNMENSEKNDFTKNSISKVVLRIPSSLGDLPIVILKDPNTPVLSLSVIPFQNDDYITSDSLKILNKFPNDNNFKDSLDILQSSGNNYSAEVDPYGDEILYNNPSSFINMKNVDFYNPHSRIESNHFNPFNVLPYMPFTINPSLYDYNSILKYNDLYPKTEKKRKKLRRTFK